MSEKYRDLLNEQNQELANVVGCGLDRLKRDVGNLEIQKAISYYEDNKRDFKELAINERREKIRSFVENGCTI